MTLGLRFLGLRQPRVRVKLSRPIGRGGGLRSSLEPPFWPPKDFIYTAIGALPVH